MTAMLEQGVHRNHEESAQSADKNQDGANERHRVGIWHHHDRKPHGNSKRQYAQGLS